MTSETPRAPLRRIEEPVNASLVEHLEYLLKEAKSGELQGVAYACSWRRNVVSNGWSEIRNNKMRVVGELFHLMSRLERTIGE